MDPSVYCLNIQSILPKKEEVFQFIKEKNISLLALNETHLTENVFDNEINLEGYDIVRCDSHNRYTGGVLFYIKKDINYRVFYEKVFGDHLWVLGIAIDEVPHCSLNIACLYRSPSASRAEFLDILDEILDDILMKNLIIMGDFNIDLIKVDNYGEKLKSVMEKRGLHQLVKEPTRITQSSKTKIDLVFTNRSNISANVLNTPKLSDHSIIELYGSGKIGKSCGLQMDKVIESRNLKDVNPDDFQSSLMNLTWLNMSDHATNVDCLINQLYLNIKKSLDIVAPLKTKIIPIHFQKWYDKEIKDLTKKRDLNYKAACISNESEQWELYRISRNLVTSKIKAKKRIFYAQEIEKSKNSKQMWKNIKIAIDQGKQSQTVKMKFNDKTYSDELLIANKYNQFVEESIIKLVNHNNKNDNSTYPYLNNREQTEKFVIKDINKGDIIKAIKKLNKKGSTDIINDVVLSLGGNFLLAKVQEIINSSIKDSRFPQAWKQSVITPIPKKRNALEPDGFRPVNSLPFLEKVFESIVHGQLLTYVNINNILIPNQSGFRMKHSCETSLQLIITRWKKWIDDPGNMVVAVSLDLRRAFETVNRDLLLEKLKKYGFSESAVKWFKCYLSDRTHVTKINNMISEPQFDSVGVPQGSILGPLLFILYINDIVNDIDYIDENVVINLFADDTLIYVEDCDVKRACGRMNNVLKGLEKWLKLNKLFINCSKSKVMHLGAAREGISPIYMNGVNLEYVDSFKYLGVVVDERLTFKNHYNELLNNVSRKVQYFRRVGINLNKNTRIRVYKTIISPSFYYCPTILYFGTQNNIDKLQLLQNKCLRVILRCDRFTSVDAMLNCLGLMGVKEFLYLQTMSFIYKLYHGHLPPYLEFTVINEIHHHNTRNRDNLYIERVRKECTKNSLYFRGLAEFNSLPADVKNAPSLYLFKKSVNDILRRDS